MSDNLEYKQYLERYLSHIGLKTRTEGAALFYQCPNPSHGDSEPSTVFYDNNGDQRLACMSQCGANWDIFDIVEFHTGKTKFQDQLKELEQVFNIEPKEFKPDKPKKKPKPKKTQSPYFPLSRDEAKKKYNSETLKNIALKQDPPWGDHIAGNWPFYDKSGENILMLDIRYGFENDSKKKNVVSFYYNGKSIVSKKAPILIYNQHLLKEDKPRLISEGCPSAKAGEQLPSFTSHTWNRGTNSILDADWSEFGDGENVYFYPDDDQKRYPDNLMMKSKGLADKIMPAHEQPGIKAALKLKEKILPKMKIVIPMIEAREFKADGADLVECLQATTSPDDIESYIFNSPEFKPESLTTSKPKTADIPAEDSGESFFINGEYPFLPLGVGDDGMKYFLDQAGRIQRFKKITKSDLFDLADLNYWESEFPGNNGKADFDQCINYVTQLCIHKDFDPKKLRGRGAWLDKCGNIVFHDGTKTHGSHDNHYIYLRKPSIYNDMGFFEEPATFKICQAMGSTIEKMTFETKLDAVLCLAWATLAPFAGALPWRPAVLLTGRSGSGKSTIIDHVVKKLCGHSLYLNGADTTPAGVRGINANDSTAIILEEMEGETEKGMMHRGEFFSMMRQSSSNDAPPTVKGTKDGGYVSYSMTNMFMFIGIDPTIQHEADSKRIFTVNLTEPKNKWAGMKKEIETVMTDENCRAVRALTWEKLPDILDTAEKIIDIVQDITKKDNRSSFAEAMMISTYLLIWRGMNHIDEWTDEDMGEVKVRLKAIFAGHEHESGNEVHDMLDKLLDTSVNIMETRETKTLRMLLHAVKNKSWGNNERDYKDTLERYGLKLNKNDDLAVEKNNNLEIIKAIGRGKDYSKLLMRHENLIKKNKVEWMAGKSRQCLIFTETFLDEKPDDEKTEIKDDKPDEFIESDGDLGFN